MAEIYAVQDGNWNDGSTWSSGTVPTAVDDVYIGDFIITAANTTCFAKKIHFEGSGRLGGGNKIINSDIECTGNPTTSFIYDVTAMNGNLFENCQNPNVSVFYNSVSFNGNVEMHNCSYCYESTYNRYTLNGNVSLYDNGAYSVSIGNWTYDFVINGKLYIDITNQRSFTVGVTPNVQGIARFIDEIESYSYFPVFGSSFIGDNQLASDFRINKITLYNAPYLATGEIRNITFGTVDIKNGTLTSKQYEWVFAGNIKQNSDGLIIGRTKVTDISGKSVNYNEDATLFLLTKKQYDEEIPQESDVKQGVEYGINKVGAYNPSLPQEANVLKGVKYGDGQVGTLEVIALSGATATADNIAVVNLTEQQVNRVSQCATKETVDEAFEEFISESATIIDKASVITGDATVIKGDVAAVNLTREQIERIKNCATVSTVQRCFSDFKNKK